jgi:formylglycine-generating enzyme required for sulfatase activity
MYVWISPGSFMMGCSSGDSECLDGEKPTHQVTLTKGFWIGQTEVTQEAYQHVTGTNPSSFKGARLPVESVTWNDARAYCQSIGMRLPTEAEWEYAARGGSMAAFYGALDVVAWYNGNGAMRTHEVAQKQANGFGLHDMLGNVLEWVTDWYGAYPSGAATDPQGAASGQYRVLRGGSWGLPQWNFRVSFRYGFGPENRDNDVGFRCAGE